MTSVEPATPVAAYARLAGVYDEIVVDPCFSSWARFLVDLWSSDRTGVTSVLDVCCGTGLLAAELVRAGVRVVGVDASAEMLARARGLLGPDAQLVQAVLPDLPVGDTFDAATSTFDGLNYLTPDDLRRTLAQVARRVRPDGWLVFDLHTDATLAFLVDQPVVAGDVQGMHFVIRSDVDPVTRACVTDFDLTGQTPEASFSERHVQYLHRDADVRAALADAGFDRVAVVDEYTLVPADGSTMRATWIARRAGGPR